VLVGLVKIMGASRLDWECDGNAITIAIDGLMVKVIVIRQQ
jgi:hypothetical protein